MWFREDYALHFSNAIYQKWKALSCVSTAAKLTTKDLSAAELIMCRLLSANFQNVPASMGHFRRAWKNWTTVAPFPGWRPQISVNTESTLNLAMFKLSQSFAPARTAGVHSQWVPLDFHIDMALIRAIPAEMTAMMTFHLLTQHD